ncbi:uncharacterized protein LOC103697875 isoform X3 [Phoenix dactylifera]|uniref:Uncharacterized protein LOC103697875 isoform X3 n=1 Tax=Phoenix dactylifera TaxID=42345 RepID=A0A8B8ZKB8_PHODC|nr:uncharacterized protein LOC103697875 isoform X3 [Phoenix dactylifera]
MAPLFTQSHHRSLELSFLSPRSPGRAPPPRPLPRRVSGRTMACEPADAFRTVRPVTISYPELQDKKTDLSTKIEQGLGPNGLGILAVSDVPGFPLLRQNLLHLAPRVANLPDDVKKELEDPDSRYNFGWSHGKEKLESGKFDTFKGSYYANPILDIPTTDVAVIHRYPSYCRPNIWPAISLPELEQAFKNLGKLMLEVGLMLAYHCDQYVTKEMTKHDDGLEHILRHSRCHKGRLLYYFPRQLSECTGDIRSTSSWCGWHTDHGSLTGLTCGMFKRNGIEIPCPDTGAGLYIKTRNDKIVKVVFGEDELAYQIGETTEVLSKGRLCATPHCVQESRFTLSFVIYSLTIHLEFAFLYKAPNGEKAFGVERSTFAMFMQPDWDERLRFPDEIHHHQELIPPNGTLTFGEYSEMLLNKYYHQRMYLAPQENK